MIKATINLKVMNRNIRKLRETLLPKVLVCAVVKADAYSFGDAAIAREIEPEVDCFAVAHILEAIRLRRANIKKPILLLGVCGDYETAVHLGVIVSINSIAEMKSLCKVMRKLDGGAKCKIHIKVNTGMNRYGISNVWQLRGILAVAAENPEVVVDGLYTHLAFEADNTNEIDAQLRKFAPFRSVMRTHFPRAIIHAASSGSASYLSAQFDMVRVGKLIYGGLDGYRTAVKVTSRISAVQTLAAGAHVGYGGTVTAAAPTICGIVPCGYADLANINFANRHSVLVDGIPCKVLGRVCMDSFMIDVTDIKSPLGKTVTIIADQRGLGIMDICHTCDIIACDLLCGLNFSRAEVVYRK